MVRCRCLLYSPAVATEDPLKGQGLWLDWILYSMLRAEPHIRHPAGAVCCACGLWSLCPLTGAVACGLSRLSLWSPWPVSWCWCLAPSQCYYACCCLLLSDPPPGRAHLQGAREGRTAHRPARRMTPTPQLPAPARRTAHGPWCVVQTGFNRHSRQRTADSGPQPHLCMHASARRGRSAGPL